MKKLIFSAKNFSTFIWTMSQPITTQNSDSFNIDIINTNEKNKTKCDYNLNKKKWQIFAGRNTFCCDGRLVMAKDISLFCITLTLLIATSSLFFFE